MSLDSSLQTFVIESRDQLAQMEQGLLALDGGAGESAAETVNDVFRSAHTIKGSAGLFGLDPIVEFTHVVESVLSEVRDGTLELDSAMISTLLASHDHIAALIEELSGQPSDEDAAVRGEALVAQLRGYLPSSEGRPSFGAEFSEGAIWGDDGDLTPLRAWGDESQADPSPRRFLLAVRPAPDALSRGLDPLAFLDHVATLGTLSEVRLDDSALPPLEELHPSTCHVAFHAVLETEVDRGAIESAVLIALDDTPVEITSETRGAMPAPADSALVDWAPAPSAPLEQAPLAATPATPARAATEAKAAAPRAAEARAIRVDADKLDHLIDVVGELIIAAAGANLVARRSLASEMEESVSKLSSLVEEVRDSALQLRMVKIGGTFNRFHRVVFDMSRELGKNIKLEISGEDTELDKTVVEKLADPLTHLVRNSIDHGIEPAEVRAARGKAVQGTVRLHAYHDSGNIVIEVSDDGGGLKRDRILAKAVERGLVEPGRHLSGDEIDQLIFLPGFSTAEQVTNLSGRGVGMDVVRRNITAVRGSVSVQSEEGVGTTFVVRLPLTLAIIHGFLVGVGGASFVLPIEAIEECVEMSAEPGRDYTNLRGQVLPFIRLSELFGDGAGGARRQNIVVVRHGGQKIGIVVDSLLGEFHTVIKPLSKMFQRVKFVTGSTILGSGEVALTLDVPALVERATRSAAAQHREALAAQAFRAALGPVPEQRSVQ